MNYKVKTSKNQANLKNNYNEREEEAIAWVHGLSTKEARVVNGILHVGQVAHHAGNSYVFPSQRKLAERIGVSERWIREVLRRTSERKFISKQSRGFKKTCLYIVDPIFNSDRVRTAISGLLPTLKWSALFLNVLMLCNVYGKENYYFRHYTEDSDKKYYHVENRSRIVRESTYRNDSPSCYKETFQIEKEYTMKQVTPHTLQATITPVERPFTRTQRAILAAFDPMVLTIAKNANRKGEVLSDPFLWIFSVCSRQSFYAKKVPNWAKIDAIAAAQSIWVNRSPSLGTIAKERYEKIIKDLPPDRPKFVAPAPKPVTGPRPPADGYKRHMADKRTQEEKVNNDTADMRIANAAKARENLLLLFGGDVSAVDKVCASIVKEDTRYIRREE